MPRLRMLGVMTGLALSCVAVACSPPALAGEPEGWLVAQRERPLARPGAGKGERVPKAMLKAQEWRMAWASLSPEQQRAVAESIQDASHTLKGLPPEKKREVADNAQQAVASARGKTPEQKEQAAQNVEDAVEAHRALTPEQREQLLEGIRNQLETRR